MAVITVPGKLPGVTLACEGRGATPAEKVVLGATSTTIIKKVKEYRDSTIQKRFSKGCQGLCKNSNHLSHNTIHTHKWRPRPPSNLHFKVKARDMDRDMEALSHNKYWLTPEGQKELQDSEEDSTRSWRMFLWCQTCPSTKDLLNLKVGQALEVLRALKVRRNVKEVRWEEEGREEWMQALWKRVGEEEEGHNIVVDDEVHHELVVMEGEHHDLVVVGELHHDLVDVQELHHDLVVVEELHHEPVVEEEVHHDLVVGQEEHHDLVVGQEEHHDPVVGQVEELHHDLVVKRRRRSRGGRGSRLRRLLAFQLEKERTGSPTSHLLLSLRGTDHRSPSS